MTDRREGWVPLMEYAVQKGVSLSTLRRHIKANKISYRLENGKYFISNEESNLQAKPSQSFHYTHPSRSEAEELRERIRTLEQELRSARHEVAELKTLVALYEEKE